MHAQEHASFDTGASEPVARACVAARLVMPPDTGAAAIRFVDHDAGTPLAYRPYRLHIGTRLVLGRTDEAGCTAVLSSLERAALGQWEVE